MNRRLLISGLFLLSTTISSCGGGGSSSNPEATTQPPAPSPSPASGSPPILLESIALISSYLTQQYTSQRSLFVSDEDVLSSSLAASGMYRSGAHYARSQANYKSHVDIFLASALAFVQQTARTMLIDKPAIINMLQQHLSADATYSSTYYSSVNWGLAGSALTSFIAGVQAEVTQAYSLTMTQVQVL
jgi:hypothetical protein